MEENKPDHNPSYIPQIGIPEKDSPQARDYTRIAFHKVTGPGFFGLIFLLFFLPFINIKCGGKVIQSYSGVDMMVGMKNYTPTSESSSNSFLEKTISKSVDDPLNYRARYPICTQVATLLAFLCAILGICSIFMKPSTSSWFQILPGFLGLGCLATLQFFVKVSVPEADLNDPLGIEDDRNPFITVEFALAYWAALLFFLTVAVLGILKNSYLRKINST